MFNRFKKKAPVIHGIYILSFTAEKMDDETLAPVLDIAQKMLAQKDNGFARLWNARSNATPTETANHLYNAEMHNPQTMQMTMDTWLIGQHDTKFEPQFGVNFFPHAMRDPQGRENYFLYYFDAEIEEPPKKFSLVDMFE